ncbi:hypothetical protein COY27_01490 [Candidatus Woesearchaeota archaeon CG_4_10_14_0_2_um_filter_33_13]|nr:MAG: hypothetical protein COY27_01490 [Candidatus Woesearchaeota archaeon CG_4_10_14_0_2_um_filter_33_13]
MIDQVVKCKRCGLVYINPRLKPELILEGYSLGSDETFVSQSKGREITFSNALKRINNLTNHKRGRILDVGTAGGSFLHVAKKDGWDVSGCEPNKWLTEWSEKHYNLKITPGTIFDGNYKDEYFDVVTLWDVLEHVPNPKLVLLECNRVLKEDGLLVINYPDYGSWIAKLMGRRWVFLLSVHLYYFTPKTIKLILNKTGYNVIKESPHFQRLSLDYLVLRIKAYSKILHSVGKLFIKLPGVKKLQVPYWIGQTLIVAKKKSKEEQ